MGKSYLVLLPFLCGLQMAFASLPAAAYVYVYHPGANEVEIDTSVLGNEPSPLDQALPQSWQKAPSAETVPAAPLTPVESDAVRPKLTKPFFGAVPLEKPAAVKRHVPAKRAAAPRKLAAPVLTAPMPAPVSASPVAAEPVLPEPVQPAAPVATSLPPAVKAVDVVPLEKPVEKGPVEKVEEKAPAATLTPEEKKPLVPEALPEAAAPKATETPAPVEAEPAKTELDKALEETTKVPSAPTPAVTGRSDLTLEFDASSSTLSSQAQQRLDGIVKQLQGTADTRVQIRGFAKGDDSDPSSARRMALARALSVRSYLMDKGVKPVRLDVRALGSETDKLPIDRVDLVLEK